MGFTSTLVVGLLLATGAPVASDTTPVPFADAATERLVLRAQARRQSQDSVITDYRARLRYRLTIGAGRRKWGVPVPVAAEEQVATIAWQRLNDLRVDITGRRTRSRSDRVQLSSIFDEPWFVPRDVDDSVRVVGADFPASGALHPLADGAELWYRYAILDSLRVQAPGGRSLRIIRLEVVPRRGGRALIAGRLWLDAETAETVRFAFRYVGEVLWAAPEGTARRDTARAARNSRFFNRFASLELDLEYGRQDGQFWMPSRQTISGRVALPLGDGVTLPFEAVTTFDEYQINSGEPIAFTLPEEGRRDGADRRARRDSLRQAREADSLGVWGGQDRAWDVAGTRPNGRFEIHRPSNDSLKAFEDWPDSMQLAVRPGDRARIEETATDLQRLVAALPADVSGESRRGFGYEKLDDAFRFNRVQGNTIGAGYRVQVGAFSQLYGTVRFGFGDHRPTGRLALVRDAPAGTLTLAASRDVASVDVFSSGRGIGPTVNAIFAAHDYADYALATGVSARWASEFSASLGYSASISVQDERSVAATSRSRVNDFLGGSGNFQPINPPVTEGTFVRGELGLTGRVPFRWALRSDVTRGAGETVVRGYVDAQYSAGSASGFTLRAQGGVQNANTLTQSLWRVGGPATLRGFPYGTQIGEGFWSSQLDVAPFPWPIRPVFFADVGQAGAVDGLFAGEVKAGGGIGLALYSRTLRTGFLRFDFSRPFETGGKWRFDVVLGGVR